MVTMQGVIEVPTFSDIGLVSDGEISWKVDQDCTLWQETFQVQSIKGMIASLELL
mgnify:CR=1 FL=1